MQDNYHFMSDLTTERIEARLKEAEAHRLAKAGMARIPHRRTLRSVGRKLLLTPIRMLGLGKSQNVFPDKLDTEPVHVMR